MRNNRMTIGCPLAFLTILLLLATGGCQGDGSSQARPASAGADADVLREAAGRWDRLFNAKNAAELASLYAEDAVSMPPGLVTVRGRDAIKSELDSLLAANDARHETTIEDVMIAEGWAIERARYSMTLRPNDGSPPTRETGRHVMCRRRVNGQWLIAWEIWNTEPAAEPR